MIAQFLPGGGIGFTQISLLTSDSSARVGNPQLPPDFTVEAAIETSDNSASFSQQFGLVNYSGAASLSNGSVGGIFTGFNRGTVFSGGSGITQLGDILTFSQDSSVSVELSLDGIFSNLGINNNALVFLSLSVIDVTNAPQIIRQAGNQPDGTADPSVRVITDVFLNGFVAQSNIIAEIFGANQSSLLSVGAADFSVQDNSGSQFALDVSRLLTFDVVQGLDYLFLLDLTFFTFGNAAMVLDSQNTGVLRFADLGGATFVSQSGTFLASQASEVPLPMALPLFLAGLAGLGGLRAARGRQSVAQRA